MEQPKNLKDVHYFDGKDLLAALRAIRERVPYLDRGLCENATATLYCFFGARIKNHINAWNLLFKEAEKWPHFSGDPMYPIPHPHKRDLYPIHAYEQAKNKWSGAYGALRYELLDFLISRLEYEVYNNML